MVTVWVYRKDQISIEGTRVNPQTNISTNIEFMPLGESRAAAVPDFAMTVNEVNPVINRMLNDFGWYVGCLYNQETGDAYELAREIRKGLDLTAAE